MPNQYKPSTMLAIALLALPGCSYFKNERPEPGLGNSNWHCSEEDSAWRCIDDEAGKSYTTAPGKSSSTKPQATAPKNVTEADSAKANIDPGLLGDPLPQKAILFEPEVITGPKLSPEDTTDPKPRTNTRVAPQGPLEGSISDYPADYYTLQLAAAVTPLHLQKFITQNPEIDADIVSVNRDGETWYLLISGIYTSMEQAQAAEQALYPYLQEPAWVRQVGPIQKQLTD